MTDCELITPRSKAPTLVLGLGWGKEGEGWGGVSGCEEVMKRLRDKESLGECWVAREGR